jgi:hypothetical protein
MALGQGPLKSKLCKLNCEQTAVCYEPSAEGSPSRAVQALRDRTRSSFGQGSLASHGKLPRDARLNVTFPPNVTRSRLEEAERWKIKPICRPLRVTLLSLPCRSTPSPSRACKGRAEILARPARPGPAYEA